MSIDLHPGSGLVGDTDGTADPLVGLAPSDRARPALHADRTVTYGELDELVEARAARLRVGADQGALHPVAPGRDVDSVVELLAAWRARRAVLMLPPGEAGAPAHARRGRRRGRVVRATTCTPTWRC